MFVDNWIKYFEGGSNIDPNINKIVRAAEIGDANYNYKLSKKAWMS